MSDTAVMASGVPTEMSQLLARVLGRVAQQSGSAQALGPVWREVVGPVIASHCVPVELTAGCLRVRCDAAQWQREMEQRRVTLLSELQARLGEKIVTRLTFETT